MNWIRKITGGIFISVLISGAFAQEQENSKDVFHFNGNVSITNNGFSFIPSFSLGKPATIANLSVGGERFSFDPQFRFDLEGLKPWSFIFIWRYKLIQTERFQLKAGAHLPAIAFSQQTAQVNGDTRDQLVPKRFITPELMPTYTLSRNINLGMYYIYGLGLEKVDQSRHTHFISLRVFFNQIGMGGQFYLNWNPQVYYLDMDGTGGFYTAHSLSVAHGKIPISVGTMMNIKLKSDIDTKDFDWNVSLVYNFKNELVKN